MTAVMGVASGTQYLVTVDSCTAHAGVLHCVNAMPQHKRFNANPSFVVAQSRKECILPAFLYSHP